MCIDGVCRWLPCTGARVYYEEDLSGCAYAGRVALSISSIAASVFSAMFFLATNNWLSLGITVALCIAGIALWPKPRGGGWPPSTPQFARVHDLFGAPLPPAPVVIHTAPAYGPTYYPPPAPFTTVVPYAAPESRVRVGDGGWQAIPVAGPILGMPVHGGLLGGEDRIPVGNHGREPYHHLAPPAPYPEPHPWPAFGGMAPPVTRAAAGEERIPVGRSSHGSMGAPPAPPPVVHPPMPVARAAAGEQRISVGRGGHSSVGAPPPSGEDRVPVGRRGRT